MWFEDIAWYRDLSIAVMGFAATIFFIVAGIVFIRMQRSTKEVLKELKVASILTRQTATIVHDGVKPISTMLAILQALRGRCEPTSEGANKHRK